MNLSNSSVDFDQNNGSNTTSNSSPSSSKYDSCLGLDGTNYLNAAFGVLIILTNIMNIIVFAQANMRKNSMNAYLLAKSACDLYYGVVDLLEPISNCSFCFTLFLYGYQIFTLIYRYYIGFVAQLASIMLEVAAMFDRYVFISQKCKFFKRIDHRLVIVLIYLFCALFYIYRFLIYDITYYEDEYNLTKMYPALNAFGIAIGNKIFNTIHSVLRDAVFVVLLIILNVLILVEMKRAMAKKKTVTGAAHSSHSSTTKTTKSKADRAEERITIMVVLTGLTAIGSHILRLVSYLPIHSIVFIITSHCFTNLETATYQLSYCSGFFFYFFFNNVYKDTFVGLFVVCKTGKQKTKSGDNKNATTSAKTQFSSLKKNGDTTI